MKNILLILFIFLIGCTKPELPLPEVLANDNIFSVPESTVTNGQSIYFDLPSTGVYTLTMRDKETNQVISREKFNGQVGENIKKIYINSIQSQYLYLSIEDVTKNELKKTIIILKK
mgnify:FL=1|jgi:hypothetical protein